MQGRNTIKFIFYTKTKNNFRYLVTPYCDGGDLQRYISIKGKLSEEESIVKIGQIVNGMQELVNKNVIHRDLKPQNILLYNN